MAVILPLLIVVIHYNCNSSVWIYLHIGIVILFLRIEYLLFIMQYVPLNLYKLTVSYDGENNINENTPTTLLCHQV